MSILIASWLFASLVIVPLALYWRPRVAGRVGARMCSLALAVGTAALAATIYLSLGGII